MSNPENFKYGDIIHLPHHVSDKRPRIPMVSRAAQFSPFAALTGYDAAIRETGRLTDRRIELSEEQLQELDRKQQLLMENIRDCPEVSVTYFVPDERKQGGAYITVTGRVKRINPYTRAMTLTDQTSIPMDEILELESDLFQKII